ncbi:hypothetical protein [Alkalicoccobacillus porphyridii]|uniref:Uncharacterized protein n=1 Tax=Alkalicoccobacillus porphyridii TaxID=2597270 RepID=A0A553ZTU9_9BACI|nr:hypothetical protein [Alkalicoccobacillus porphyridii]TSB44898.1 hypothetical protein FN960_18795 [Alkalicoccobacillus porphyridii]
MDEQEIVSLEQWKHDLEKELKLFEEQKKMITSQIASLKAKKEIIQQVSNTFDQREDDLDQAEFEQHFEMQSINDELERLNLDLEYVTTSNHANAVYNDLVIQQIEQKLLEWEQRV